MKFIIMANLAGSMFYLVFLLALVSQTRGSNKNIALFIFGDSFLDAGNNNYINTTTADQANFWPYGETYFKFPTGRFSDGRLISDFIAEYANLPLIPPFLQPGDTQFDSGANFASGGAGALVETFQGKVIPLKTQARNFKKVAVWLSNKLGNSDAKILLSNSVYMFSIGANDYFEWFSNDVHKSYSHSDYVDMVVGNVTSIIKEIYELGTRKFVFINLPPLGSLPNTRMIESERKGYYVQELAFFASLHNQALFVALFQLEKELKGFKFSLYNFNYYLTDMINYPEKYGLREGKSACCGSGPFRGEYSCGGKGGFKHFELCDNSSEHVFWDSFHLSENAYKQLAAQMWGYPVSSHTIGPYTIKELFQADSESPQSYHRHAEI